MADTRQELLNAAERLLRTKGLASTREIAREAGCADGTLYNHFKDRLGLYMALLMEHIPNYIAPLTTLPCRVGEGSVQGALEEVGHAALAFFYRTAPLFGALFAEPPLLAAYREAMRTENRGPHLSQGAVLAYLRAEQRLGRVGAHADPVMAAQMLFSTCFQRAFWAHFSGVMPTTEADRDFVQELSRALHAGLTPVSSPSPSLS